jgi:hypothetical protein
MGKSVTTSAKNIYHCPHQFADGLSLSRSKQHPDSQRSYVRGCVFHRLFAAFRQHRMTFFTSSNFGAAIAIHVVSSPQQSLPSGATARCAVMDWRSFNDGITSFFACVCRSSALRPSLTGIHSSRSHEHLATRRGTLHCPDRSYRDPDGRWSHPDRRRQGWKWECARNRGSSQSRRHDSASAVDAGSTVRSQRHPFA